METLKRDWDSKLTLRDVLVTICCLLIQPNPDSALNAEAGALIQEGYEVFERRARLMTSINAGVPRSLVEGVREAQTRGQEMESVREPEQDETLVHVDDTDVTVEDSIGKRPAPAPAPVRRRRGVARLRSAAASRRSEGSPSGAAGTRRQQLQPVPGPSSRPFVAQSSSAIDPFSISIREDPPLGTPQLDPSSDDDESTTSADQENDICLSPAKPRETPSSSKRHFASGSTPRRPQGAPPVPLGELSLEDASHSESEEPDADADVDVSASTDASDNDMEEEYPPSPRKSPSKSPAKKHPLPSNLNLNLNPFSKPQRAATALFGPGARNFTPPNALTRPLASDSPYTGTGTTPTIDGDDTTMAEPSPSPRKARTAGAGLFATPAKKGAVPAARRLFDRPPPGSPAFGGGDSGIMGNSNGKAPVGVRKKSQSQKSSPLSSPPSSAEKKRQRDKRLWELCGGDVKKWNRGEFGEEGSFAMKAARW